MQTVARIAQRLDSCSFIAAFIDLTGSGEAPPFPEMITWPYPRIL